MRQGWVIEDHFPNGSPAREQVGAQMTSDVLPYEKMKIRLLNASHQTFCHIGRLCSPPSHGAFKGRQSDEPGGLVSNRFPSTSASNTAVRGIFSDFRMLLRSTNRPNASIEIVVFEVIAPLQIQVVGFHVLCVAFDKRAAGCQLHAQLVDDRLADLILDCEHVGHVAVGALQPEVIAVGRA